MRKLITIFLAILLILAGCKKSDSKNLNEEDKSNNGISAEEVINQVLERQNTIKSVRSKISFNENIIREQNGEKRKIPTNGAFTIDRTVTPDSMYISGFITTQDYETNEKIDADLKIYLTDNTMYLNDAKTAKDVWVKASKEEMKDTLGGFSDDVNASDLINSLKPIINKFKVEENESEYILTLSEENEKYKEYILEDLNLENTLSMDSEEILKNMKFDKVNTVIKINKNSYDLLSIEEEVSITIQHKNKSIAVESNEKITYSDVNKVKEIKIPQKVIKNAIEYK